jgi:hypothetical protein
VRSSHPVLQCTFFLFQWQWILSPSSSSVQIGWITIVVAVGISRGKRKKPIL